jgi:hypothetical protein
LVFIVTTQNYLTLIDVNWVTCTIVRVAAIGLAPVGLNTLWVVVRVCIETLARRWHSGWHVQHLHTHKTRRPPLSG